MTPMRELSSIDAATFRDVVLPAAMPVVLRGVAAHWPIVRSASPLAYLRGLDNGAACTLVEGGADIGGRFFYDAGVTGFNFTRTPATLTAAFDRLEAAAAMAVPPALAIQAVRTGEVLPGFVAANPAPLIGAAAGADVEPRLWIGNRVVVATHHDLSRNLAVCVAGRRRFTLFPPDQVANLYVGPLEFSPAGTPISMVDARAPDLDRYPRFAAAMASAEVAELAPGDAIYIPYMWWHQVESLDPVSILANYWWNETPPTQPGLAPIDVLMHARLAFSAASPEQRAAWRATIDHMIFDEDAEPVYLPEGRRGIRGPIGETVRTRMRRQLGALLGR